LIELLLFALGYVTTVKFGVALLLLVNRLIFALQLIVVATKVSLVRLNFIF
jgi:hypothetical protein